MDCEKKKYNQMENVLNKINQRYISLPTDETKRNNKILGEVSQIDSFVLTFLILVLVNYLDT